MCATDGCEVPWGTLAERALALSIRLPIRLQNPAQHRPLGFAENESLKKVR
jgi:hypothetical protein